MPSSHSKARPRRRRGAGLRFAGIEISRLGHEHRSAFEDFEISGLRWVHSLKGWSWLACVNFTDHGHVRSYALFIQDDAVIDGRYAVETDACGSQTYTPFDMDTGTLGRPTVPRQPPIY